MTAGASRSEVSLRGLRCWPYLFSLIIFAGSPVAAAAPVPQVGPLTISDVQGIGGCSSVVTITWTTNHDADSQIEYGTTTDYGSFTALNGNRTTSHSEKLEDLAPNTLYHYRVRSNDESGNLATSQDLTVYLPSLAWDRNSEDYVKGYKVSYGAASEHYYEDPEDAGNITMCTLHLFTQGAHYVAVRAYSDGAISDFSDEIHVAVGDVPPLFLYLVRAAGVSGDSATITWTTDPETDSQVEYGTSTDYGNVTAIDSSLTTAHSQALNGLSDNTFYHYRVKSRDAAGNFVVSGDFTFFTPDVTPPRIADVAISGVTTSSATIRWTTDEISDSHVDYGTTPAYGNSTGDIWSVVTSSSVVLTGLSDGTTYHFRLISTDIYGNVATSSDYTFTTTSGKDTAAPIIFDIAFSNVTASSATITWTTDENADSQVHYGKTTSYGSWTVRDPAMVTSHSQTLTGLSAGTTYHFRVRSRDGTGNLGTSADLTCTTDTVPLSIMSVTFSGITPFGVAISWITNLPADSQVSYGLSPEGGLFTNLDATMMTSHTQYLSGLEPNTIYYVRVQSRHSSGGVVISEPRSFRTASLQTVKLVVPRLVTNAGGTTVPDDSEHTGIAVANLSDTEAFLTFTAYDNSGALIAGASITNPAVRTLPAGAQLAIMDVELFGSGLPDEHAVGWVEIDSSVDGLTAFMSAFNSSLSMMDGAPVSTTPLTQFVFTEIEGQGFTQLHVANPNDHPAKVTFQLVQPNGIPLASAFRTINPMGTVAESASDVFPGLIIESSDYIRVVSDEAVFPFELLGKKSQDVAGLNGASAYSGAASLYCPQYVVGGSYRSTLSIVNLDGTEGSLTLRLIGDNGAQIGVTRTLSIAANGKVYISDQSFFAVPQDNEVSGYVEINSSGPSVVGNVVFGDVNPGTSVTALPLVARLGNSLVFGQVASDQTWFMGLALLNPNNTDAVATLALYQANGSLDASIPVTIPAHQRISKLLYQHFPELQGRNRSSGYVRVTSDKGIAGYAGFGTNDLKVLSAVPAQILQ